MKKSFAFFLTIIVSLSCIHAKIERAPETAEQWRLIEQTFDKKLIGQYDDARAKKLLPLQVILCSLCSTAAVSALTFKVTENALLTILNTLAGVIVTVYLWNALFEHLIEKSVERRNFTVLTEFLKNWPEHKDTMPPSLHKLLNRLHDVYQKRGDSGISEELEMIEVIRSRYKTWLDAHR